MDARPRISLGAAPPPYLSTTSSSGSFPIRAPPTPDDDEPSDLHSNFPDATTNSNSSDDIYSNCSSSYYGFDSGADYETAPQDEDGSDRNLFFFRPFVPHSDPDDGETAQESVNVDKNSSFRPFVLDPGDEILEEDDVCVDKNRFFRPFVGESDNEVLEYNGSADKDEFFRPFVVDPDDQIDNNLLFRPFVSDLDKEMVGDNGCVDKDGLFRPFVADPDDEIVQHGVAGADKSLLFRPFVADPDKEMMEESGSVDEVRFFSYAAESDEDSSVAEREDDADDEICFNFKVKAKDSADPNRVVSMPIARLSMEFDDEAEFSITEDIVGADFDGATVEGQEMASESSIRTMDGSALETESRSVSIQQFDPLEMDSSELSAEKDANETAFMSEPVTENTAIDYSIEKSSKPILDEDEDAAESTETASQENEIDDFSQLNPIEEHEEPLNSSSFFNFMALNPDLGTENPVFDMNGHEDDEEKELSSSERTNLENLHLLKVQFLRFIHKLGFSVEDPTAVHVLHSLNLAANSSSFQQIAVDINAIEEKSLDFSLNILVMGKSGVGKSSTINSIFQEQKVEIDQFEPATRTVKEVVGTLKNGINVRIFDTPGLRQSAKEQGFNRKTLAFVKKLMTKFRIDAVLYVDRLDSYDESYNDLPLLQTISDSLGVSIWRKVVVVFTHASVDASPLSYGEFVRQRHNAIQRCFCVINPDEIIQPVLLIENNHSCEKSRDRMLLLRCSMKTMNEACSLLGVSGRGKWGGNTRVSVDVWSRFSVGSRKRLGFVVGLDVARRNWKITVGASLTLSFVHSLSSVLSRQR